MRTILHILTWPEDELAQELMARQRTLPETKVEVVELIGDAPDYAALVGKIFAADSVEVW
jgi:hypothetical protein